MASLLLSYIVRNVIARKLTTLLTAAGMALVVYVFASVLMLTEGIRQTLVQTGQSDNVIVIRRSSGTEVQSGIERDQAALLESLPGMATAPDGRRLVSKETVVLINMPKRGAAGERPANVTARGTTSEGLRLRPQVRLVSGRMFRAGTSEIVTGHAISRSFRGGGLGESMRFAQREWKVVGVFDAGNSGFDSEIWGDAEQFMQAFRRPAYSSVLFKLADARQLPALQAQIAADARLPVEAKPETQFYAEQSEALAQFIHLLGTALSLIFSIGAVVGAMITMYASVASRTGEIGTLRALGFSRGAILSAFLIESLCLGLIGAVVGLGAASLMTTLNISTLNWQTFAELAFGFKMTPFIVLQVLLFALAMGLIGGFLPAARAARMKIVDALRAG